MLSKVSKLQSTEMHNIHRYNLFTQKIHLSRITVPKNLFIQYTVISLDGYYDFTLIQVRI